MLSDGLLQLLQLYLPTNYFEYVEQAQRTHRSGKQKSSLSICKTLSMTLNLAPTYYCTGAHCHKITIERTGKIASHLIPPTLQDLHRRAPAILHFGVQSQCNALDVPVVSRVRHASRILKCYSSTKHTRFLPVQSKFAQ